MDSVKWIGYEDSMFGPDVSAFTVAEYGAHKVFAPMPVPASTQQLFGEIPTPGIGNANFIHSTPVAADAFPFVGGNGAGSGAPRIFNPRLTSAAHQFEPHSNANYPSSTQLGSLPPIWVSNAIDAQSEWCSSSIERHTQPAFDVMSPLQGRVLLVRILHAMYPVTLDMLNHLFSLYGSVEKIVYASPFTAHQVLIQYQQHQMASLALRVLQGHSLYPSCCYLEVKYALGSELQVLCPSLGVGNIFASGSTYKEHQASTMCNQRVVEQPAPVHILDELPSIYYPEVAVQLCNSEVVQAATMVKQGNPAFSTPLVMHVDDVKLSTNVQEAPSLFQEMPVYDVHEEDGNGLLNLFVELCDTAGQQKQYNSEKPIYDHEEPHCAATLESDNELLAVCFNNTSDNAFGQEGTYFRFPHGPLIHDVRSIELTKEKSTQAVSILYVQATVRCDDWISEINIKKQEVLINKHDMVYPCDLNTDKVPLSSGPCIWDPGIDLFSYKKLHHFIWIPLSAVPLIHQLHTKNFCSWWDFSLKKGRQVQWDPGIKLLLYEFWRLKTLSKGTEYAMRHLFSVKFGTHNFTYFSDTADIMCCPLPNLLQHGRNVAEVLRFWRSIFNSMHHWQICHICTTMSSLFHCHGIPLWLINFQVP